MASLALADSESQLVPEEELYWLALRMVPGLGARNSLKLLQRFHSPRVIMHASRSELEASGLSGSVAQSIASGCSFEDAARQQALMRQQLVQLIPYHHALYPALLREIFDPPPVLFAWGKVGMLATDCIGVVGTRRPSAYGAGVAERMAADLAQAGLTVVSGMARGIDTAAHKGVLGCGGNTIAVWGCGVDVIYPSENRKLANQIAEKGLVLSEFPMESPAYPQNFPIRNRIISGVSSGILVVEGAQYSGSAITARLAMEQSREVFAIPGNITSKASWGPNLLIKQGAKLVQDWNDVVTELPVDVRRRLIDAGKERLGVSGQQKLELEADQSLSANCRNLLENLHFDRPILLDELIETLDSIDPSDLIAGLFELEMMGLVRQLPGKNFVKVW